MNQVTKIRAPSIGTVLLFGFVLSFGCSPAVAHDVHSHAADDHAETASTRNSTGDVRELIREFRQTGDDHYLDEAWSQLEPLLATEAPGAGVLVDAATVAQARHDFEEALALLDRALLARPNYDQAWLLRASISLVRGEIADAQAACDRLHGVAVLVALTCDARVAIAQGDHAIAMQRLGAVIAVVDVASVDAESIAWALSVAGDAAAVAEPEEAIHYYRQSLDIAESTQVRAAMVDVLLSLDRVAEAHDALDDGHHALPLDIRRFIVAKRSGDFESVADEVAHADHEFRHWIEDEDWAHAREMTRFYIDVLDRPALAERLARINLGLQREPEDLLLARRVGECESCAR
ncbi:MAG: tetratricopeptide repeat protein [Woeseiaceae bacterium]|nr:tetratricopeptide repeat protein [Woeseiaceae bacterium]